tara:strand:- start:98 stop:601 length:504 start_codon:yes stop_codon:yes gene_type:complete
MKKLLYTLLAVSIIFSACEKEEEEPITNNNNNNNTSASVFDSWNVVNLVYDITEGVYTSGSYPNGSFTITNITSGVENYALQNQQLTHEFSSDGLFTQIFNDDISNNQVNTSYSSFVIVEDSIFFNNGQKGGISVTENILLMDLFHIDLSDYPNFQSFQFNHTSERE